MSTEPKVEPRTENILPFKGANKSQRQTRTSVDTVLITQDVVERWKSPPFQRPLRVNDRVIALAESLKQDGGVFPGVLTLGVLSGVTYIVDGQHRLEAFKISGLTEGYADVRTHYFQTVGEMGEEFVLLNSSLVKFRPDDILRGLEGSIESLQFIRRKCSFVGYDQIRRGERAPIISMSQVLRCWNGSAKEVPATGGTGAVSLSNSITPEDSKFLVDFLLIAEQAWGRDREYARLWATLNLTLCMWLYRRTVIAPNSPRVKLSGTLFAKCLMEISADSRYIDWLSGRSLRDLDRSPAYSRIKTIFSRRAYAETGKRVLLPAPAFERGHGPG